ncbi:autophagy protein 6 [Arachnomyces sp. PD_36]|nr:autophagy protein 6 [Arachnomyces sp. PD_36]
MATNTCGNCAVCGTSTTKLCSGCSGAPAYEPNGSKNQTFYCTAECQKSHWDTHKPHCRNLQARKKLLRAAQILQGMTFAIFRNATEMAFDTRSVKPVVKDGVVKVVLKERHRVEDWPLGSFPETPMDLDGDIIKALMVSGTCMEAHAYLASWAKLLLSGICSTLDEVLIYRFQESKLQIIMKESTGKMRPSPNTHLVYRARLPGSGETWAVDLTGAQYGYDDAIYSWNGFMGIVEMTPVGQNQSAAVHMEFDDKRELRDTLNKNIPALVKKYGGDKGDIIGNMSKLSEAGFNATKQQLVDDFEGIVQAYMVKYDSPKETRKRCSQKTRVSDFSAKEQQDMRRRLKLGEEF